MKLFEEENKKLKEKVKELEKENKLLKSNLEGVNFQLEQIKIKLFGKKSETPRAIQKKEKKKRDIFSYQRPIPKQIIKIEPHPIAERARCHGELQKKRVRVFFEEDIPLSIRKIVIRREAEAGYCNSRKKQSSGITIPSKKAVLGGNVKKYVCVLSIADRLSHNQIQDHLKDVFNVSISIGEIGNIRNQRHKSNVRTSEKCWR